MSDPEFWQPRGDYQARGRPRTVIYRSHDDYPPGNPLDTLCRLWQGAVDRDGYGVLSAPTNHRSNAKRYVHRWVWEMAVGPIPKGMVIRHRCDNPVCFRLSHLELGTTRENNMDAVVRGHAGRHRMLTPMQIIDICKRHDAGETYRQINKRYPHVSLGTIKIARRFLEECQDLHTASPSEASETGPTSSDADAGAVPQPTPELPGDTTTPPSTTPPS